MSIELTDEQSAAFDAILKWRRSPNPKRITLGGLAGVGKSTLVSSLQSEIPNAHVMAFTGKACEVLRRKGVSAQTIHSTIYSAVKTENGFIFRRRLQLDGVSTLIVDEASMLPSNLIQDIESFRIPVVYVGDHGQLPPIYGDTSLMESPDIVLETIHRQAADSPILRLAHFIRAGGNIARFSAPDNQDALVIRAKGSMPNPHDFDQLICGKNRSRVMANRMIRGSLGRTELVEPGDKLICLANRAELGFFNGQTTEALTVAPGSSPKLISVSVPTPSGSVTLPMLREQFNKEKPIRDIPLPRDSFTLFDYGYCITCHKSQGSEWPRVLLANEPIYGVHPHRWLYTGITRASSHLTLCL